MVLGYFQYLLYYVYAVCSIGAFTWDCIYICCDSYCQQATNKKKTTCTIYYTWWECIYHKSYSKNEICDTCGCGCRLIYSQDVIFYTKTNLYWVSVCVELSCERFVIFFPAAFLLSFLLCVYLSLLWHAIVVEKNRNRKSYDDDLYTNTDRFSSKLTNDKKKSSNIILHFGRVYYSERPWKTQQQPASQLNSSRATTTTQFLKLCVQFIAFYCCICYLDIYFFADSNKINFHNQK